MLVAQPMTIRGFDLLSEIIKVWVEFSKFHV
jgi:hypothetical protein